jgi:hypothetical protein
MGLRTAVMVVFSVPAARLVNNPPIRIDRRRSGGRRDILRSRRAYINRAAEGRIIAIVISLAAIRLRRRTGSLTIR